MERLNNELKKKIKGWGQLKLEGSDVTMMLGLGCTCIEGKRESIKRRCESGSRSLRDGLELEGKARKWEVYGVSRTLHPDPIQSVSGHVSVSLDVTP